MLKWNQSGPVSLQRPWKVCFYCIHLFHIPYAVSSLASQTLTQGERVWSNCYSRAVAIKFSLSDFSQDTQVENTPPMCGLRILYYTCAFIVHAVSKDEWVSRWRAASYCSLCHSRTSLDRRKHKMFHTDTEAREGHMQTNSTQHSWIAPARQIFTAFTY